MLSIPRLSNQASLALTSVGLAVALTTAHATELPKYSAEKNDFAITLKCPDGRPILRYVVATPPKNEQPQTSVPAVGYMHPVYTPSGQILTESGHAGGDHTWLRGVFLGWPQVFGNKPAGFWTFGQSVWNETGKTMNREALIHAGADGASIFATNLWTDGQRELLVEKTHVQAALKAGVFVIDVKSELSAADKPVTLLPWAFAGLAFHGRRVEGESVAFFSPEGEVKLPFPKWNDSRYNWPHAAWYDLLLIAKDGRSCGLAMMAHAANGKSTWQAYRNLRMLNPNVAASEALVVERTKPLVLRYRLVAHDDRPPTQVLNQLAADLERNGNHP